MSDKIEQFQGSHRFLSNFWPCVISLGGETYNSVEHAYQAAKTNNQEHRRLIRLCQKPGEAKRLGRRVELRPNWNEDRISVMRDLVRQKFCDPELKRSLLLTGERELVEGNEWNDRFWGVCRGEGQNWLGRILMDVRSEIEQSSGATDEDDEMPERNQWYGREFCPHPDAPCIDGCSFCGARLDINEHNHTKASKRGEPERYECVCFNC